MTAISECRFSNVATSLSFGANRVRLAAADRIKDHADVRVAAFDCEKLVEDFAFITSSDDQTPTHVQVVPAEILTKPGANHEFKVRLFNSNGQLLKETEAEFTLDGPGAIEADGSFKAAADATHQATIVTAKVGDLTGRARVRTVPRLPWKFDFEGLDDLPVTWVGARYRHVLRKVDNNTIAVKVTTIPKGTRSRCWFGHSDLNNYTIQADVRAGAKNNKLPDIGLIAQGYALDMQGASQKLQIRTWVTQLRMATSIDLAWEAGTWYTLKLKASTEKGKAILSGKVWPRDEDEPEGWMIEAIDDAPNLAGSPGLFGNASDAEVHLDNILVTAN